MKETGPSGVPEKKGEVVEKITSGDIENTHVPIHLNGLVYLPSPISGPYTFSRIGKIFSRQPWFEELSLSEKDFRSGLEEIENDGDIFIKSDFSGSLPKDEESLHEELGKRLVDLYTYYKISNKGQDPTWFKGLDPETQKFLSFESIWSRHHDFPPVFRFAPMLYAGINCFAIEDVEKYEDLDRTFNLFRLTMIKQFGYKQDPLTAQLEKRQRINSFNHQRYRHVFSVLALANLMGSNLGLSPEDLEILQIAAVTHDYRTPAGGDTTKNFVDPELFDEDLHYNEIFQTEEWKKFVEKYGISKEREDKLYRTVLGEGILGKLLDIADKTTYVSGDADMYLNAPDFQGFFRTGENTGGYDEMDNPGFQAIKSITNADNSVCNIWDSVEIIDGQVVFTNGTKLANFLRLRALMFQNLYWSHYSRFFLETFVGKITRHLWDQGILTKEILLEGNDSTLNSYLQEFIGLNIFLLPDAPKKSEIRSFNNLEEAEEFARSFDSDVTRIAIVDDVQTLPDPATKKFLVRKGGEIIPFNEAFPEQAEEIGKIMEAIKMISVHVLSFDDLKIPESHRAKVKAIFSNSQN